ncbi:MAG: BrnT family toxin [Alphaproteobacteria bacterium]|uniref:BrnT family toxin n=1 Tax=Candidatus Nitrobium versatile TaxID=2884831 RepID=A0A953M0A5_9BACT|nr:BrnT family toxin [Candidatus Nitrobium versatile]
MKFEGDPAKSAANKLKHGIDFAAAKDLWLDENRIEIHLPYPLESRRIIVAKLNNRHWTAVYTMRSETIRIISVRRSREKEIALYDKEKNS